MSAGAVAVGSLPWGAFWVWLRNATVWGRSWKTSLVGTVGEPLFYFLGLGYGLGTLIPEVGGQPYLHFVAPGLMLSSVMQSTTIESTYSTLTKMEHQKVFASMVLAPLSFPDVVLGEILWAVTKGLLSGTTVLLLALLFGAGRPWPGVLGIGLLLLAGFVFASMGMIVTSIARSYDFFNYYFTLFITPMFFFSGIFYPVASLGPWVEAVAWCFPLTHLVTISRALMGGGAGAALWADVLWLLVFGGVCFALAMRRMSRRFMG
ncbi:MAG: ABC transporter permease [Deferrisomatales bacterium]|nr:ABC transporter permease [Deferrisomatales bacterium]